MFHKLQQHQESIQDSKQSRRELIKRGGVLGIAASLFNLVPFAPLSSKSGAISQPNFQIGFLDATQSASYVEAVLNNADYRSFKQTIQKLYSSVFMIQEQSPIVRTINSSGQELVSVAIPVSGGAGYSAFAAVLNPQTKSIEITRYSIFTNSNQNIRGQVYVNGQFTADLTVTPQGGIVGGWHLDPSGRKITLQKQSPKQALAAHPLASWSCLSNCLSSLGLASWVIVIIGIVCIGACVGTAGLGCLICVFGLGLGAGGEMGWCLSACN